MDLTSIRETRDRLHAEIHKVVVGQDRIIDLMFTSLLSGGHILLGIGMGRDLALELGNDLFGHATTDTRQTRECRGIARFDVRCDPRHRLGQSAQPLAHPHALDCDK